MSFTLTEVHAVLYTEPKTIQLELAHLCSAIALKGDPVGAVNYADASMKTCATYAKRMYKLFEKTGKREFEFDEVLKMIDDNPMWNLLGFEEQMVKFAKDSAKRKLVLERFEPLKGLATLWKDDFVKRYADKEIGV